MGEGGGVFFARNLAVSPVTAVNKAVLHLTLKLAALTHTNEIVYAWWKKIYLKHVHILENVVNICIINDLSYQNQNQNQNELYWPGMFTHTRNLL